MSSDETNYRHCTLSEFRRGSNATVATKNISSVYGDVVSANARNGSPNSGQVILI